MSEIETQDRDGVGHTLVRKMEDALGDLSGFRTRIHKEPGREVMLRTKGGKPEVTEKREIKVDVCIKGPLTEIAFKYVNPSALTGYRRWYGEPDPVVGTPAKETKYEWSSDGLLCMEARKLQKICCTDANEKTVDFLFAERPTDDTIPAADLPAVSAAAASSTARFRFTEGKYPEREWYGSEVADIGWAFSGPTIEGNPDPEPASAVKFFVRRVRSIMFTVSDTLAKLKTMKIKWIFANQTTSNRTLGATTAACTNQNARELSFYGRHFFTPSTDGNMDKLTMSVGLDEPPAVAGGPSFTVEFKKPGSFIAAIDPEGATGNTRPAEIEKAIDLCEFSAFGNPYHGLFWWDVGGTPVLYRDSTKAEQWGFTPTPPQVPLFSSLFSGFLLDHRYYNFSKVDPLLEENIKRTTNRDDGVFYKDALLVFGQWWVKDADVEGWGNLNYYEQLYKDPAGTVWVLRFETYYNSTTYTFDFYIRLKRRYGILGTEWHDGLATDSANRQLATISIYTGGTYRIPFVSPSPDGKQFIAGLRNASDHVEKAWVVTLEGAGAVKANVPLGIVEGAGITATTAEWAIVNSSGTTYEPILQGSAIGQLMRLTNHIDIANSTFTCGTHTETTWHTETRTVTYEEQDSGFTQLTSTFTKTVLDIQWIDGRWQEIVFVSSENRSNSKFSMGAINPGVKTRDQTSCTFDSQYQVWVPGFTVSETFLSFSYSYTPQVNTKRTALMRGGEVIGEWIWSETTSISDGTVTYTSDYNYGVTGQVASVVTYDDGGWGQFGLPQPVSLTPYPRAAVNVGYWGIPSPQQSPLAWTVRSGLTLTALAQRPNVPLIYRDGLAAVDPYNTPSWTDPATTHACSARIGWAYDYRSKELIAIPFGSLAYFI